MRRAPVVAMSTDATPATASAPEPVDSIASGFLGLFDSMRRESREDFAQLRREMETMEERLTERIDRGSLDHAKLHDEEKGERREVHGRITEFIRQQELADARRDGVLGAMRFTIELVSRNAGRLGYLAGAGALLIGFLTGSLHVQVGP